MLTFNYFHYAVAFKSLRYKSRRVYFIKIFDAWFLPSIFQSTCHWSVISTCKVLLWNTFFKKARAEQCRL